MSHYTQGLCPPFSPSLHSGGGSEESWQGLETYCPNLIAEERKVDLPSSSKRYPHGGEEVLLANDRILPTKLHSLGWYHGLGSVHGNLQRVLERKLGVTEDWRERV